MKPVAEILPGCEIAYVLDQPIHVDRVLQTMWRLNWVERLKVLMDGHIWITVAPRTPCDLLLYADAERPNITPAAKPTE